MYEKYIIQDCFVCSIQIFIGYSDKRKNLIIIEMAAVDHMHDLYNIVILLLI